MDEAKVVNANDVDNWPLIKRTARAFIDESTDSFECAVVMIAALFEGPSVSQIVRVTGYPQEFVSQVGARLETSGLWQNDRTEYDKWDHMTKMGFIRFVMDLGVAEGKLLRTGEKRNGEYVYRSLMCECDPVK